MDNGKPPLRQVLAGLRSEGIRYLETLGEAAPVVRGREILFVFHDPSASSVNLVHHVTGIPRSPGFERVKDGLFLLHMVLPEGARLEYTYRRRRVEGDDIVLDPRNPRIATCPFGPKSVAETGAYRVPDCVPFRDEIPRGDVEEHAIDSRAFGGSRSFSLYAPSGLAPEGGWPLLVVHDGGDYRHFSDIVQILDNLIASGAIPPLVALLTHPVYRNHEYTCTPEHPRYVAEELVPWVRKHYPVTQDRDHTVVMGASFGAVASVYAAHRYPDLFGGLFVQSGSFFHHETVVFPSITEPVDEFDRIRLFFEAEFFPKGFPKRVRMYHSCGTFEPILSVNRSFAMRIRALGHDILYRESHDGHNWVSWRDHFGQALPYLFSKR